MSVVTRNTNICWSGFFNITTTCATKAERQVNWKRACWVILQSYLAVQSSFSFSFRLWQTASTEIRKARNTTCSSVAVVFNVKWSELASIIIMSTCAPTKFQVQSIVVLHICSITLPEAQRNDGQNHKHLLHWLCHRSRGKWMENPHPHGRSLYVLRHTF